jgi:hypothetical protein
MKQNNQNQNPVLNSTFLKETMMLITIGGTALFAGFICLYSACKVYYGESYEMGTCNIISHTNDIGYGRNGDIIWRVNVTYQLIDHQPMMTDQMKKLFQSKEQMNAYLENTKDIGNFTCYYSVGLKKLSLTDETNISFIVLATMCSILFFMITVTSCILAKNEEDEEDDDETVTTTTTHTWKVHQMSLLLRNKHPIIRDDGYLSS